MLRPSFVLTYLTALCTFDTTPASGSDAASQTSQATQAISEPLTELSEDEKIVRDAPRQLGSELRRL